MTDPNPAANSPKLLLNVDEVAGMLSLGRSKLYSYILSGELKSLQLGRRRPHNHRGCARVRASDGAVLMGPLDQALTDHGRGWAVIDVPHKSKSPARDGWQNERLGEAEIRERFSKAPCNLSVLLGGPSGGLTDIDLDCAEARLLAPAFLPTTDAIFGRPTSPASHWLYYVDSVTSTRRFVDPTKNEDTDERTTLVEIRSTGCHTLFPGSTHPNGEQVSWSRDGDPERVNADKLSQKVSRLAAAALLARHWPGHGSRQDAALALAGGLLRAGWGADEGSSFIGGVAAAARDEETAKRAAAAVYTEHKIELDLAATGWPRLAELLDDRVVARVREWLGVSAASESPAVAAMPGSQADTLVAIGMTCELFHDDHDTAFARLRVGNHLETWSLRGRRFQSWLRREHHRQAAKAPSADAVNAAVGVLEGVAQFDGPVHRLENRIARRDGEVWYDLTDQEWQAVRVGASGWLVVACPPPIFRRYAHQQPQVVPTTGGDPWLIFRFLNVRAEHQLLLLCWLIAAFIPDIPHPIVEFYGEKGSAKSAGQRVLRRLIDPSSVELLSFHGDLREVIQQLAHHYAPVYDNLDALSPQLSDLLCRAVTGEGFTKRELYSDDDDVIYQYRRIVLLNGINVAAQRPDLLDRTILVGLERIGRNERRVSQPSGRSTRRHAQASSAASWTPSSVHWWYSLPSTSLHWSEWRTSPAGVQPSPLPSNTRLKSFSPPTGQTSGTRTARRSRGTRSGRRCSRWWQRETAGPGRRRSSLLPSNKRVCMPDSCGRRLPGRSKQRAGQGRGKDLQVRVGSFYERSRLPLTVLPEWGCGYEVYADEEAVNVERMKWARVRVRESLASGAKTTDLTEDLGQALPGDLLGLWKELQALNVVLGEVAREFDGEDVLKPKPRADLDRAKQDLLKAHTVVRLLAEEDFELPDPDEETVNEVREFIARLVEWRRL